MDEHIFSYCQCARILGIVLDGAVAEAGLNSGGALLFFLLHLPLSSFFFVKFVGAYVFGKQGTQGFSKN